MADGGTRHAKQFTGVFRLVLGVLGLLPAWSSIACQKRRTPSELTARSWKSLAVRYWRKADVEACCAEVDVALPKGKVFTIADPSDLAALRGQFRLTDYNAREGGLQWGFGEAIITVDDGGTWELYLNSPQEICAWSPPPRHWYFLQVQPGFYALLKETVEKHAGYEVAF